MKSGDEQAMFRTEKIPLKAFWETVKQRLAACSADELRTILRAMAQETAPRGRGAFLEKLERVEETSEAAQQAIQQEELLVDIADLAQELKAAMEGAEPWEERYGWDEYDDEDSLGPYEEFVEPLVGLFDRTEAAFDYGNRSLARAAYRSLFQELSCEDDYGRGVGPSDLTGVDMDEACARYLCAVYETEPPDRRPQALFEQMRQVQSWLFIPRAAFDDLVQVSPRPLPDREQFLADWIAFLRTQSGGDADAWLREAVRLSQGTRGLEALARAEGRMRPRAYLDWFTALEQEGKHQQVLLATQEALQALPAELPIRAAIADHLCLAAARLNEKEALRAGRWEAFLAKPSLSRLLDLWDAVPTRAERTALMQRAVRHLRDYLTRGPRYQPEAGWDLDGLEREAWIGKSVLAHACLLAGDFEAAHQLAAAMQVLGWSSSDNPQGLVMSFFLVRLSGRSPSALSPSLAHLWQWGLQYSVGLWFGEGAGPARERLERAYAEQFAKATLSDDRQERILSWCLKVAQKRVNAIVGGQRRKSYGKAAVLTVACAEVLRLRGKKEAADSLVAEIRARFPRHSAFHRELRPAVEQMEHALR